MFIATKTLTITEDAYGLLKQHKMENESFSEEIARVLSPRPFKLSDFFGILSDESADALEKNIKDMRKEHLRLRLERLHDT